MKRLFTFKKLVINKKCEEKGFTLLEVLIALTVFAIGLLALAGMQITGIKGNATAQSVSAKVALGSGVIEEIMAIDSDMDNDNLFGVADFLTTDRIIDPWPNTNIDIPGAGTCSSAVAVTVLGTATDSGLTEFVVTTTNPTGSPVIQTVMKRRY